MDQQTQRVIAVIAGCNYGERADLPPLEGAEADALAIARALQEQPIGNGRLDGLILLLGAMVTREAIAQAGQAASRRCATSNDTLLFYFAGHGGIQRDGADLTLYTWDGDYPVPELLTALGWPVVPDGESDSARWPDHQIRAVLDCCEAADAALATFPILQRLRTASRAPMHSPFQALFGCAAGQAAQERGRHGVFTGALIHALEEHGSSLLTLPWEFDRWLAALYPAAPPQPLAGQAAGPPARRGSARPVGDAGEPPDTGRADVQQGVSSRADDMGGAQMLVTPKDVNLAFPGGACRVVKVP